MKEIMRRREKEGEMKLTENRWRRGKMESRWTRRDEGGRGDGTKMKEEELRRKGSE